MTSEPRWLAKADIVALQDHVLLRTGGSPGSATRVCWNPLWPVR